MTEPTYRGEVQLLGWTHSDRQGMTVRLRLHPDDAGQTHPFRDSQAGERFATVLVLLKDEEPTADAPDPQVPGRAEKPKRHWSELSRAQQAGLRCNDAKFRQFLVERYDAVDTVECAAEAVRDICGVWSRSAFDKQPEFAANWDALNTEFERWAGYLPEDRS